MEFDFEKQQPFASVGGIALGKPPLHSQPKIYPDVASFSESKNYFDDEMLFQMSTLRAFLALGFFLIALSFREIYFAKEDNIKLERGIALALKNLDEKINQSELKVNQKMKETSSKLEEKTNFTKLKIDEFIKESKIRQMRIDELSEEIKKLTTTEEKLKQEPVPLKVVNEEVGEKEQVLLFIKTPEKVDSLPILQPSTIMKKSNRKKKESQTNKSNSSNKSKSREIAL